MLRHYSEIWKLKKIQHYRLKHPSKIKGLAYPSYVATASKP